jgi:hypothetical protein
VLKGVLETGDANDRKESVEVSFFLRSILLATDGSDEAKLATQAATELSKETGSEVHQSFSRAEQTLKGLAANTNETGLREGFLAGPRVRRALGHH